MSTIVPEDIAGASDELEALANKLAGNEAFAKCRNTFLRNVSDVVEGMIGESANPTEFCQKFDAHFAAVRVMGNILAQLKRDGNRKAYEELKQALETDDFFLTGQDAALDETIPITLLMLEPAKTLTLLEWMKKGLTAELNTFVGISHRDATIQEVTRALFAAFPTLEQHTRLSKQLLADNYHDGAGLLPAYKDEVAGLPDSFAGAIPLIGAFMERLLRSVEQSGSGSAFTFPIAYMFIGKEQSEVLGMFDRERQQRIATWQLRIPRVILRRGRVANAMNIGIHPETEHVIWKKKLPPFVSKGVTHRNGIAFLTHSISHETITRYRLGEGGLAHNLSHVSDSATFSRTILVSRFKDDAEEKAALGMLRIL